MFRVTQESEGVMGSLGVSRCMNHCMASVGAAACAGMIMNEKDLEEHTHTFFHTLTNAASWFIMNGRRSYLKVNSTNEN